MVARPISNVSWRPHRLLLGLMLLAGILAAACAPGAKPAAQQQPTAPGAQATAAEAKVLRGGTIRTFGVACGDIDLSKTWCSPHSDSLYNVYRDLLKWRSDNYYDLEFKPDLAESWDISKDGLTYTFHIRKGMKFPDVAPVNGREFDASDVAFNIDMVKKDKRLLYNIYRYIDSYTMPDKYTINIKLSKPYGAFLYGFGLSEAGVMWTREIYERDGNFAKDAIGVGPFMLDRHEPQVRVELKRNPNYWEKSEIDGQQLPYVDRYSVLQIRDDAGRLAAFRAKRMDQWYAYGFAPLDDKNSLLQTNPDVKLVEVPHSSTGNVGFNSRRPPFDDLKARQAAMYAVDKDLVMEQAWGGGVRSGYFHPNDPLEWDANTIKSKLGYDLNKAKQLLKESGYAGAKVRYSARTEGTQGAGDIKSAQVVVQMLNEAGFNAELVPYQDMAQAAAINKAGEWELGGGSCGAGSFSNSSGGLGNYFGGCRVDDVNNFWGNPDPKVDQMQTDALFEPDPEKAAAKWKALRDFVYDNMRSFNIGAPMRYNIDQPWLHLSVKSRQHFGSRSEGIERAWLDDKYTGER